MQPRHPTSNSVAAYELQLAHLLLVARLLALHLGQVPLRLLLRGVLARRARHRPPHPPPVLRDVHAPRLPELRRPHRRQHLLLFVFFGRERLLSHQFWRLHRIGECHTHAEALLVVSRIVLIAIVRVLVLVLGPGDALALHVGKHAAGAGVRGPRP